MKLAALILSPLPLLLAQPDRFATPACSGGARELASREFFSLCYDPALKVPLWTGHEIKPEHLQRAAARPAHFHRDNALAGPIARNEDYRGSGFSRGHLVPAEDLAWSGASIRSTFVLSNAVPQRQQVNAGKWRQLEAAVRGVAACSDAVFVFSGPVFSTAEIEYIGAGRVAVPTHFFKVALALAEGRKTMYAAILPNAPTAGEPLSHFTTSVEEVQRLTGLDFFAGWTMRRNAVWNPLVSRFPCHRLCASYRAAGDSGCTNRRIICGDMKILLTSFATLFVSACVLTAQDGAVTYVSADKVTAALAKGGPLVTASNLLVSGSHREKGGQVEVHDKETDVMYIVDGSATFVTGGTMIGGKDTKPGQHLGADIKGGETHHLKKGDVVVVPAGTPHWFKEVPKTVSYYVVKVLKP